MPLVKVILLAADSDSVLVYLFIATLTLTPAGYRGQGNLGLPVLSIIVRPCGPALQICGVFASRLPINMLQ
jgi:hypothetical protein